MIELTKENFEETLKENPEVGVMFWMENCPHCEMMKPKFLELAKNSPQIFGMYKCDPKKPDQFANQTLIKKFPTFVSYKNGQQFNVLHEGSQADLSKLFNPEPKQVHISQVPMMQLMSDEIALIDKIAEMKTMLNEIRGEIKRRRDLVG